MDDDEEDSIVLAQLLTPENDPYDDKVFAEDWNLLFLLTMKMIKLMDFNKFLRLKCVCFLVQS